MAGDLYVMLAGNVSAVTGENVMPNYRGNRDDQDSFLLKVVTPIYNLIADVSHSIRFVRLLNNHSILLV